MQNWPLPSLVPFTRGSERPVTVITYLKMPTTAIQESLRRTKEMGVDLSEIMVVFFFVRPGICFDCGNKGSRLGNETRREMKN